MKVLLHGKNSKNVEPIVKSLGFNIVTSNPEVILSFGGDGTLLSAERLYPGIPKLPLRNSQICNKCPDHEDEVVLKKLIAGKLKLKEYRKLETSLLYKSIFALNDFVVRNFSPIHAIRFQVNDKFLIGDGIVISTPFGSTGYFSSVAGQTFKDGFGLAFNNITEKSPPIFLKEKDSITFNLIRGQATLSFDNSPDIFTIDETSQLVFKLSNQTARIYEPDSLRCPNCQVIRG